jgi:hypothetical protein
VLLLLLLLVLNGDSHALLFMSCAVLSIQKTLILRLAQAS